MFAFDNRSDLAQHCSKFHPWIQRRLNLMFWIPLRDFFAICSQSHIPGFFYRVPTRSKGFRLVPFGVRDSQVCSFSMWNIFSHHPNLLGMSYLLGLFDRENVVADAFGIRRRIQDFLWRIREDLNPMINIASVTLRIVADPQFRSQN